MALSKEIEYLLFKSILNTAYGMMVTNIARGECAHDSDACFGHLFIDSHLD